MLNTFLAIDIVGGGLTPPSDSVQENNYIGLIMFFGIFALAIIIVFIIGRIINKNKNDDESDE